MNSDGSGKTQLTENYALALGPTISADGSKIALSSDADGDYEIYVVSSEAPLPPPAEGLTLVHDKEWYWTDSTTVASVAGGDVDGD